MPESIVTSPDGQKFRVTHPEGASEADIMSFAQAQLASEGGKYGPTEPDKPLGKNTYSDRSTGDVMATGVPRGFFLGGGDEMSAAVAATLRGDVPGKTWGERYGNALAAVRERTRADRENRPVAAYGSEIAGGVASTAPLFAGLPAAATGLGRIGQGAGVGLTTGQISGFLEGEGGLRNRLENAAERGIEGGVVGAAIPAAWEGAKVAGRTIRNVVGPLTDQGAESAAGRLANRVAGDRRADVVNALTASRPIVPGSQPTAGQASVPAGSAEFAALQEAVARHDPSRYVAVDAAQEGARRGAIQDVGLTKHALEGAEAFRSAGAARNYPAAYNQALKADPALMELADNPYFQKALPTAMDLAKSRGIDSKNNLTEFLHLVKIGIDKQVARTGEGALVDTEKRAAEGAKNKLLDWLKAKNPAYDFARSEYAAISKPINRMEIGQALENKLVAPLETSERAAGFAQAVRDAPRTIKTATGGPRYTELDEVLTPSQVEKVTQVVADLQRDAQFTKLARAGAARTGKLTGEFADPVRMPNLLDRGAMIVNAITRRIEGKGTEKIMGTLAEKMTDPAEMARIMRNATPRERSELVDIIMRVGTAGVAQQQR